MRYLTFLFLLSLQAQDLRLPLADGSVRFAALGDMGTGQQPQYDLAKQMFDFHQKFPYTFVIMLGDDIYGGKSPDELKKKFDIPYKPLTDAGVQFYASLGNHDDPDEKLYKPFNMNGQQYYSFSKGKVQFFVLDTDYLDPKQVAWVDKELASSKADWKICFFHHPLYSSGKTHGSSREIRAVLEPMFIKYGVQVVFSGHDHIYERVKPQKGIYYWVVGAGGELRYGDIRKTDMTAAGFDKDRSFLAVEIAGDTMYYQALSRTGITIDSGTIQRAGTTPKQ